VALVHSRPMRGCPSRVLLGRETGEHHVTIGEFSSDLRGCRHLPDYVRLLPNDRLRLCRMVKEATNRPELRDRRLKVASRRSEGRRYCDTLLRSEYSTGLLAGQRWRREPQLVTFPHMMVIQLMLMGLRVA
jgi:hypothetical protein